MSNKYLVYTVSLGCPKNLVDTEIMAGSMVTNDFGMTGNPDTADVFLINTCAFIPPARLEAESVIKEAVEWKKKKSGRKIVVAGCLIQWDKKREFMRRYEEVDLWIGIDESANLAKHLSLLSHGKSSNTSKSIPEYIYNEKTARLQLTPKHFSYVKIADGCDNRCSYCSIPGIRGRLRSRNISSITKEAENLLANGSKELILIAQDITAFGNDLKDSNENLVNLLKSLDHLKGDFWIRLLYTHPAHFSDDLIDIVAGSEHVIHYIDMPLQHISDKILKSMGRKTDSAAINRLLDKIHSRIPDIAIRTTFLTGYPGETENDFNELAEFIRVRKFQRLGAFTYFPEPETPAASFDGAVPAELAEERKDELMKLQAGISLELNQKLVGRKLRVLLDKTDGRNAEGRTYMDAPEIDNSVVLRISQKSKAGDFVTAEMESAGEYVLTGKES